MTGTLPASTWATIQTPGGRVPSVFGVKHRLTPKRPKRAVENAEYAAFVRRALTALGRRVAAGDVEGLADLIALADQLDTALHQAVSGLRDQGYSWAEIGARAGTTRQAAHQRWRHNPTDSPEVT